MTVKIAVYPGTFDPFTFGHLDVVKRSSKLFDKIIVSVAENNNKSALFNLDERIKRYPYQICRFLMPGSFLTLVLKSVRREIGNSYLIRIVSKHLYLFSNNI